jgi:hypothetical protein
MLKKNITFRSLINPLIRSISCWPNLGVSEAILRAVVCDTDFKKYDSQSDQAHRKSLSTGLKKKIGILK